jgi:hypothetical protein
VLPVPCKQLLLVKFTEIKGITDVLVDLDLGTDRFLESSSSSGNK